MANVPNQRKCIAMDITQHKNDALTVEGALEEVIQAVSAAMGMRDWYTYCYLTEVMAGSGVSCIRRPGTETGVANINGLISDTAVKSAA